MAKVIQFEGQSHSFPDDFTDAEIAAALQGPSEYRNLPPPEAPGFDAKKMVRNIPGSAVQFAKDVTAPIHSPVQTAKGLWKAGSGAAQLAIPGEQGNEGYARAVGTGLKERYGGTDRLRTTLQNDPVGLLGDVAGLVTGGAGLAGRAGLRGAATAAKVGRNLDPAVAAQRAAGAVIPKKLPRRLTESALKLPTTMKRPDRAQVVETVLENKLLPNERGYQRLLDQKEALGDQLDALIAGAAQTGGTVPLRAVTQSLAGVRQKLGGVRLGAGADLQTITDIERAFLTDMRRQGKSRLTVEDLQKLKTEAYKSINFNRSQQKASNAGEEAYKAIARDARGEIEKQIPEIADVNRRYGALEQAEPVFERAANRIGNRDMMGIGVPIKATAGGVIGGVPGALFGLATGGMDTPTIKARTALLAESLRKKGFGKGRTPAETWTTQRAMAAQAGRMRDEEDQPK